MNWKRAHSLAVTTLVSSMLILGSGCQSGGFKPDLSGLKPDMGKLAFWKKDDIQLASQEIPPPSAHFSPDRADPETVAEAKKQNLKNSVDAIIAEAKRNKTRPKDPTIQTYGLDPISPNMEESPEANEATTQSSNDFVGGGSLQSLKKSATDAVESTQAALQQAGQIAKNSGDAISGIQQQSKHAASQIASGVTEGLARQANNIVTGATATANDFLSTTSNQVQQTVNTVQDNLDNSFKPKSGSSNNSNPYLGAMNNSAKSFSGTGNASALGPISKTNSQNGNAPSDIQPTTGSAALQPLNNSKAQTPQYPSTSFGSIQPVQANSSGLPASLRSGSGTFAPGSTKPLQPLR